MLYLFQDNQRKNERYLNTTFHGEEKKFGAIFMDYRNVGEEAPHIIIYGHQSDLR